MTHIPRRKDKWLHNEDGTHRITPSSTSGWKLEQFQKRMAEHRAQHVLEDLHMGLRVIREER